jgi:nitroreductase
MSSLDLAVVDELLATTRSVRKRLDLDRPVDPALVDQCLELSLQAPTGGNTQGWRWLVVTDPELRAGLADIYARASAGYLQQRAQELAFGNASLYGSILPAVWSFMLAARARNLGTVLTTLHLKLEAEAAELLGVPDKFLQVGLIPVAHTDPAVFKPVSRPPLESVRFRDRWPVDEAR